jgi:hypothetical protein
MDLGRLVFQHLSDGELETATRSQKFGTLPLASPQPSPRCAGRRCSADELRRAHAQGEIQQFGPLAPAPAGERDRVRGVRNTGRIDLTPSPSPGRRGEPEGAKREDDGSGQGRGRDGAGSDGWADEGRQGRRRQTKHRDGGRAGALGGTGGGGASATASAGAGLRSHSGGHP